MERQSTIYLWSCIQFPQIFHRYSPLKKRATLFFILYSSNSAFSVLAILYHLPYYNASCDLFGAKMNGLFLQLNCTVSVPLFFSHTRLYHFVFCPLSRTKCIMCGFQWVLRVYRPGVFGLLVIEAYKI